jgi:hypothetical protein
VTVLVEVTVGRAVFVGVIDFVDVIVAVTVFVGTDDFVEDTVCTDDLVEEGEAVVVLVTVLDCVGKAEEVGERVEKADFELVNVDETVFVELDERVGERLAVDVGVGSELFTAVIEGFEDLVGTDDFVDVRVVVGDFVDVMDEREVGVGSPDLVEVNDGNADLEGTDDFVADLEEVEVLVGNKLIFSRYLREEDESKQNVSVRQVLVSVVVSSGYTSL